MILGETCSFACTAEPHAKVKESSIFFFFKATPVAYGGSQVRGQIKATAANLHHSHSNAGSALCLQTTPQLMAMPNP